MDDFFQRVTFQGQHDQTVWQAHCCADKPVGGHKGSVLHQSRVMRYEINSITGRQIISASDPGQCMTVQLDEGDCFPGHHYPDLLREVLEDTFSRNQNVELVLACKIDYEIAGQTVDEFIRASISASTLQGRVRVSHLAFVPMLEDDSYKVNDLAQASRYGLDPWDRGRAI